MITRVDVFRGSDRAHYASVPLRGLFELSVARILGWWADDAAVLLLLHPVPDDDPPPAGRPAVHNLLPEYGYATVEVRRGDRLVYRHPHTVAELVGAPLQEVFGRLDPAEAGWGFAFSGLAARPAEMVIPTPAVQGVVPAAPFAAGEQPVFGIRRLPDPVPPPTRLADHGVDPGDQAAAPVKVLLAEPVYRALALRGFSAEVEEGGFLLGRVFADADAPGTFVVRLTDVPPAQHTGASLLHLTFTGDSFEAVKRGLRTGATDDRLVGWYHTHLFPAGDEMGLSSIDVRLHFTTFLMPWQLAGLVNVDGAGRTLRFYARRQDAMTLCPYWVTDAGL